MADSSPLDLPSKAIDAAINCRWEEALKLNRQIIQGDPENIDALNRQAKAYFELGKLNLAKKYYSQTVKFDPYNPIAIKNLKILQAFKKNGSPRSGGARSGQTDSPKSDGQLGRGSAKRISPLLFLQEPGKTKVVSLLKVAEPQKLSQVFPGMCVSLVVKNHKIHILDQGGIYLGVLPDDLSYQLLRLLQGGNKYEVFIKAVRVNGLSVLIRETFRSSKFKGTPSFLEAYSGPALSDIISVNHEESEPEEGEEVEA